MFNNLLVSSRLIILTSVMAIFMVAIGIIGLRATSTVVSSLETVYTDRTVPLADLGKMARLYNANIDQILRALQHNPEYEVSKLHDHPVSEHIKRIEANRIEINKIWDKYMASNLTPEEKQLAETVAQKRKAFLEETLQPTVLALNNNDYSVNTTVRFLKGSRTNVKEMSEALQALTDLQIRVAKEEFDRSQANHAMARTISI